MLFASEKENTIEEKDSNFDFATENNNCVKVLTDKLLLGIFTKCIGNCLYFLIVNCLYLFMCAYMYCIIFYYILIFIDQYVFPVQQVF